MEGEGRVPGPARQVVDLLLVALEQLVKARQLLRLAVSGSQEEIKHPLISDMS